MPVIVERNGSIATVILSRSEVRNAVDRATADALAAAFLELEADDAVRVSVLFGAAGTFCAGADLKTMDNRLVPLISREAQEGAKRFVGGAGRGGRFDD